MNCPSNNYHRLAFLILVTSISFGSGAEKYWLPDVEWQTKSNWEGDRIPETDSHVVFPLATRHAVGIAKFDNLRLSGIDLSREGLLVLFRDGKLEVSNSKAPHRKVSKWSKEGHYFWADPQNWNVISEAAPHLERVPCRQEHVVLPPTNRTFSVTLPIAKVEVKSVRMADQDQPFSRWEWEHLRTRREFRNGRETVEYTPYSCMDCTCQDASRLEYLEEICAIEKPRCGFTPCEYPLTVEGHCCRYCGGRISLGPKDSLPLVRSAASSALEGYVGKVDWHARKTWDGVAEILVKEKGNYSEILTTEAVEELKRYLQAEGFEVLKAETAGAAVEDARLAIALGTMFGAPLIIVAFLLLVFLHFGYTLRQTLAGFVDIWSSVRDGMRPDKPKKPFSFARFENISEGNVEIADAPGTSGKGADSDGGVEEDPKSAGGRFENPLYRSKRRKSKDKGVPNILDLDAPLSLTTLKDSVASQINEVEMDIE